MAKNSSSRKPLCRDARKHRDLTISGIKQTSLTSKAANPPGQHGAARKRSMDYGAMLAEKQKLRLIHGNIKEKQFRKFFEKAAHMKGQSSLNLLQLLEIRLVNIVFKAGFASTLSEARQLIAHRAIEVTVPGKMTSVVNCPSYLVKEGYVVSIRSKARAQDRIAHSMAAHAEEKLDISWIKPNHAEFSVEVLHLPDRDQLPQNINENFIVEFYSK